MSAQNTTPVAPSQFQPWASFFGGNVTAPYANPTAFGANALGAPPSNGQYTGGWAYPDAWANFYEGTQGFQAPQNQNSPAGALAAANYSQNTNNPNDPNLLGWEKTFGNPFTTLQHDQNWAQSLGSAPTGTPSNELTGGWQNPEAWAAYYGGTQGFAAPENAGSPASALAAASQIAQTSSPESNPALLGWIQDFGQPGSVLANVPNWEASLGDPNVNAQGQGVDQTNTQGWDSPLAWAAYYGGFQGYQGPVDNTLQAAQNWAGVTDQNNPSLLGWTLDYGDPQTVVSTIQASPEYQAYLAALAEQERLANLPPPAPAPAPAPVTRTRSGKKRAARQAAAAAQAAADAAYYTAKPVSVNGAGSAGGFLAASGYGSSIAGATSYGGTIAGGTPYAAVPYGSSIAGSPAATVAARTINLSGVQGQATLVPGTDITSFVTRGVDGSHIDIRSDGSIYVNGQLSVAPVRALQSARLYNTPGSGVNVPSFGTNNIQGAGGASGAFGLEQLPRASGAAVGGDPFNALYNYTNTTFAQAFTAGETTGGMVPPGAPIEPLFGGKGGEGGFGGGLGPATIQLKDGTVLLVQGVDTPVVLTPSYAQRVADAYPFDPFADPAVSQAQLGSPAYAGAIQSYLNYLTNVLHGAESGQAPGLGAPGDFNEGFIQLPPQEVEPQEFNRNVDDFGRPIPDVGSPQPFSLPDFGGLTTSIEQTFGNLGTGWAPPAQGQETPAFSFQPPDFGGMENTIQQTLSGFLPGWTPPAQQEEQPGTFWGSVLSGLGNLGVGFDPRTPETSGINEDVSVDQVAQPGIVIPGGSAGEFGGPPPFVPLFSDLSSVPSFPGGTGGFAPNAFEGAYVAPPPDVFTDPGMGNAGFGASTLYQGGYGEPELMPSGPELSGDVKLQKASDLLAKAKGLTLGQLGKAFGLPENPNDAQTPQNVKDYKIDLNNLPKAAADIWAMLPAGASLAGYSEQIILQMLQTTYNKILAKYGTDSASVKMAGGAQSWDVSGLPPGGQQYNTVPIYGDPNSGIPSYGAPGAGGFPRPPADVGPQGPPRPPGEIPGMPFQGGPFAGAPDQGRGELSYSEQPTFQFARGTGTAKMAPDGNPPAAFIVHTTDTTAKTPQEVVEAWKSDTDPARQGIGSTYIMDPKGNIYRTEEDLGYSGNENFHNSRYPGITNATVLSMEVMAPNEASITPEQQQKAVDFLNSLYSDTPVLAHSQVSPEDRTNEGEMIANATGRVPDLGSYIPMPRERPTGNVGSGSTFYPAPPPSSGFQTATSDAGIAVPSANAARETTPEGLHIAPDQTAAGLGLDRIDPTFKRIVGMGMTALEQYMPGYQAQVFSGYRGGSDQAAHAARTGGAMDIQIVDPDGNTIPHRGQDTTGLYTLFAQIIYSIAKVEAPDMIGGVGYGARGLNWGGSFNPGFGGPNVFDLEHWDFSGIRGQNTQAQLANLPDFIWGETQPEQAPMYNPEGQYNLGQGYNLLGPFHGITRDPSTMPSQGGGRPGGEIGPVIQQIPRLLQTAYDYFNPPSPTFDSIANNTQQPAMPSAPLAAEPEFESNLEPQQLEPTFPSFPGGTGGFAPKAFGGIYYNPPPDVAALPTGFGGGEQTSTYRPSSITSLADPNAFAAIQRSPLSWLTNPRTEAEQIGAQRLQQVMNIEVPNSAAYPTNTGQAFVEQLLNRYFASGGNGNPDQFYTYLTNVFQYPHNAFPQGYYPRAATPSNPSVGPMNPDTEMGSAYDRPVNDPTNVAAYNAAMAAVILQGLNNTNWATGHGVGSGAPPINPVGIGTEIFGGEDINYLRSWVDAQRAAARVFHPSSAAPPSLPMLGF